MFILDSTIPYQFLSKSATSNEQRRIRLSSPSKNFSKLLYTQQKAHHQKNKDFKKFFKHSFKKNTKVKERPDVETGRRLFMFINSYPKRV
jgi:hypothetical protein